MIDPKILDLVRCPQDGQALTLAPPTLIAQWNAKIQAGQVCNLADNSVDEPMEQALMTADGARLYPIRGGIPTLVVDEAIAVQ